MAKQAELTRGNINKQAEHLPTVLPLFHLVLVLQLPVSRLADQLWITIELKNKWSRTLYIFLFLLLFLSMYVIYFLTRGEL